LYEICSFFSSAAKLKQLLVPTPLILRLQKQEFLTALGCVCYDLAKLKPLFLNNPESAAGYCV
jgi:hypothetical protein